jgi:hypothetical protein
MAMKTSNTQIQKLFKKMADIEESVLQAVTCRYFIGIINDLSWKFCQKKFQMQC